MRVLLPALIVIAGCAAPPPTHDPPPPAPVAPAPAAPVAASARSTPTIALKGSKVVSQAEASAWVKELEPARPADPDPVPDDPPFDDAPPSDEPPSDQPPFDLPPSIPLRPVQPVRPRGPPVRPVRPVRKVRQVRKARPAPPPRPPEACGRVHPPLPAGWNDPTVLCRGRVHVVVERHGLKAARAVLDQWATLKERVEATPLARLAWVSKAVFVFVYRDVQTCMADLRTPHAGAAYYARQRLIKIGRYRSRDRFEAVLRHELAHHLQFGVRSDAPRWVKEGISELFEATPEATFADAPPELPLTALLTWHGPNTRTVGPMYRASRTLVGGLLRSKHGERFAELVASTGTPWPGTPEELFEALGVTATDLREAYSAQRTWRESGRAARVGQQVNATLSERRGRFQFWMVLIGVPCLLVVAAAGRAARRS